MKRANCSREILWNRARCASEVRRVRWDVTAIGHKTARLTRGVGRCEDTGRVLSFNVIEPLARAIGLSPHTAPMPLFELDLPRRPGFPRSDE